MNSSPSFLLARKPRSKDTSDASTVRIAFPPGSPLLPSQVSFCLSQLSSCPNQGLAHFDQPNSGRSTICEKQTRGKCRMDTCFPRPRCISRRATWEHRRRFSWSCSEHASPRMKGDKDDKSSQTCQTGIVRLKRTSWTKPLKPDELPGTMKKQRLIHTANSHTVRVSEALCCMAQTHRMGNVSWTTAAAQTNGDFLPKSCTAQKRSGQNSLFYHYCLLNSK